MARGHKYHRDTSKPTSLQLYILAKLMRAGGGLPRTDFETKQERCALGYMARIGLVMRINDGQDDWHYAVTGKGVRVDEQYRTTWWIVQDAPPPATVTLAPIEWTPPDTTLRTAENSPELTPWEAPVDPAEARRAARRKPVETGLAGLVLPK